MARYNGKEILFMAVEPDKYELPIYVTDNLQDMSDRFGVSKNTIKTSIAHDRKGNLTGRKFVKVEFEENE